MNKIIAFTLFSPLAAVAGQNGIMPVVIFGQFTDPVERAFTVNVPQDWKITGGSVRRSAVDVRHVVRAASPDGSIQIFWDDPNIVPRQVPDGFMVQIGMREGQLIQGAWGGPLLLEHYRPGNEYARQFVAGHVCPNAQFTGGGAQAPETEQINREASAFAARYPNVAARGSAGDAYFTCGSEYGYATASTVLAGMRGPGAQVWGVLQMAGFKAKKQEDVALAMYVIHNMIASFKVDPRWEAQNNRAQDALTAGVTHMQNRMMTNLAEQSASRAASERSSVVGNRPSDVMSGWEARNKVHDGAMLRDANARRGVTTVTDPAWGSRTVSNTSNYYWTRPDGSIIGTNTNIAPQLDGGGWRMMDHHE